jgi:hypothetical protein
MFCEKKNYALLLYVYLMYKRLIEQFLKVVVAVPQMAENPTALIVTQIN